MAASNSMAVVNGNENRQGELEYYFEKREGHTQSNPGVEMQK